MKQWQRYTAAALLAAAALMGLSGCGGSETKAAPADGKKHLAVVQIMQHGSLDAANQGAIDRLAERGWTADKIDIDQQNAQGDQSNLKNISSRFRNANPDVILAISTPAAQSVANEIHDIPIVGVAITDFETARLVKSNARPETNVTGVNDRGPVEEQVEMGLVFVPDAKTMGLLYCASEINSEIQAEQARVHAAKLGLAVQEATVSNVNDIQQAAESIAGSVDFIYVPTDNVFASSIPTLVKVTDAAKIPVFAAFEQAQKDGAFASLSVDYYGLGKQAGVMAARILKGEAKPETTPIETQKDLIVIINQKNAEELGITIPEDIAKTAKMV